MAASSNGILRFGLPPNWITLPADKALLNKIAALYPGDSAWQGQVQSARAILSGGNAVLAFSLRRQRLPDGSYFAPNLSIIVYPLTTPADSAHLLDSLRQSWPTTALIRPELMQEVRIGNYQGALARVTLQAKKADGTVYQLYIQTALLPLGRQIYALTLSDSITKKGQAQATFAAILSTLHFHSEP